MKRIFGNLWQSTLEHPFPGLNTHAYLLTRDEGNLLYYNTGNTDDINEIVQLGGIEFQFLSHRHETGKSLSNIKKIFNSKLCTSDLEARYVDSEVDMIITERQMFSSDIEIIPTPGHTDGGLSFYCQIPGERKTLFTGDTLYRSQGGWKTLVFTRDGGNANDLISSLETLRLLEPDVVISSAYVGNSAIEEMDKKYWRGIIDSNIEQLS